MSQNQNFAIRQDTATGLFGIIKNDTNAWAIQPRYIAIDPIESAAPNAGDLFIVTDVAEKGENTYHPGKEKYTANGLVNAATGATVLETVHRIENKPSLEGNPNLLVITSIYKDHDQNKGLFDIVQQRIVIPCAYASFTVSELSPAYIVGELRKNNASFYGLVDGKTGKLLMDFQYKFNDWYTGRFSNCLVKSLKGQCLVKDLATGLAGVIDEQLQFILPMDYYLLQNGYLSGKENDPGAIFFYLCRNKAGKVGMLDQHFNTIIPFEYDDLDVMHYLFIKNDNHHSILPAKKDNLWGVINYENKVKISLAYDNVKPAKFRGNGAGEKDTIDFIVTKNGLYGVCDLNDTILIPVAYKGLSNTQGNEYAYVVEKDNKYGIVTTGNETLLPLVYDLIMWCNLNVDFSESLYKVKQGKKTGLFDVVKKTWLEPAYTEIENILQVNGEYWIQVTIGKKTGFIDVKGNSVIEPVYEAFWDGGFIHNVIGAKKGGKWGLIDHTGKAIVPFEYAAISNTSFRVSKNLLFKTDASLPCFSFHLDELLKTGGLQSLAGKAAQVQPYDAAKDGLRILEGMQLVYEQGDFDVMDNYRIEIGSIAPDLVFCFGFKREKNFIDTVVVDKKLLQSAHRLQGFSQGSYDKNEAACPVFCISEAMYTELKEKKQTSVSGLFGFPEGGYIKAGKAKKAKVKVNKATVEIPVLQGTIFDEKNNADGEIQVWDNPAFPLVIKVEVFGDSCHAKLKEIAV